LIESGFKDGFNAFIGIAFDVEGTGAGGLQTFRGVRFSEP